MLIFRSPHDWPESAHGSVMALGNFDGVHKGHQAVISRAKAVADEASAPLAIMSFEPHPRRFFKPDLPILRLVPLSEKLHLLRELGVDYLYLARFNERFSTLSADDFVGDLLARQLRVHHIVTGYNFAFGHQRGGDAAYLARHTPAHGMGYTRVGAEKSSHGEVFSSTAIRQSLEEGEVEAAAHMLGRPYCISGPIIHGDKRGRTIGFPTANLRPAPLFWPKFGVYAVTLHVSDGRFWQGVANFGVRPTVGGTACLLESHLFNCNADLYGLSARVDLHHFIRAEATFGGLEALKAQIESDRQVAERYFADSIA